MATPVRARLRWTAARDGRGHAFRGQRDRAVCGAPLIREMDAWPETSRCRECVAIVEGMDA